MWVKILRVLVLRSDTFHTSHTHLLVCCYKKITISAALITFQVKSSALSERISMHNVLPSASPKKKKKN